MSHPIYLLVGVPGVGKTWIANQVGDKFNFIHHDGFIHLKEPGSYLKEILRQATITLKPILIEAPFSISQTKDPLENAGHTVIPIFIIEEPIVLHRRYLGRDKKPPPKGHFTRMNTYSQRADEWKAFKGTSSEVLNYLKEVSRDF